MKKNIAYYLEDTSRLSEIDNKDLNDWLAEMPYSQPLRLLVKLKEEQGGNTSDEAAQVYGAYYAEDYEPVSAYGQKEQEVIPVAQVEAAPSIAPLTATIEEVVETPAIGNTDAKQGIAEIVHNLTDDVHEDIIESDLLEINPNTVLVNEVYHEEADEVLEDIVEDEVLEKIEEVETIQEESIEIEVKPEAVQDDSGKVKYDDYTSNIVNQSKSTKTASETGKYTAEIENEDLGIIIGALPFSLSTLQLATEEKAKKKKAFKKAKKKAKAKSQRKAKATLELKTSKPKLKAKKKKGKKKEKREIKKLKIKTVKGTLIEAVTPKVKLKTKKVKSKKPKSTKKKKEVKYVVLNNAAEHDFKLNDFEGVSNYTSWLLDKEPINGDAVSKKDKKKNKKKKKKKSKVLKVAADSVKKSDLIISEPLADIMAAQGHSKKARKMYTQLSLIFPEKSSYFAAKIEKLKKK